MASDDNGESILSDERINRALVKHARNSDSARWQNAAHDDAGSADIDAGTRGTANTNETNGVVSVGGGSDGDDDIKDTADKADAHADGDANGDA